MGEVKGVGVYCETKGFERKYKIEKDVPISSAELKAKKLQLISYFNKTKKGSHTHWLVNGMPNTDEGHERRPTQ
jgi:hypothetical protein